MDRNAILGADAARPITDYIRTKQLQPDTMIALRELVRDLEGDVRPTRSSKRFPPTSRPTCATTCTWPAKPSASCRRTTDPAFTAEENAALDNYKSKVDKATKFIPTWVKVAVALALGMGTMVGWKRIVVTVGEKIGKEHLTYAQGATAELVAMATIFAADNFGLPVSTTHVLSSGVAGTMAANESGLQMSTIRNIAAAWVFTLPAAALLSGLLFWLFRTICRLDDSPC